MNFFKDADSQLDFFSKEANIDRLLEAFALTMDEWKEVPEEPLGYFEEQNDFETKKLALLGTLQQDNWDFSSYLSCVEQTVPNSPEGEVTRTFIRQQGGEVDVYSMTEPDATTDSDKLVVVAPPRRKGAGRPRKRRITRVEGHRPEKRRVRHSEPQLNALVESHGWKRAIGCCPDTVVNEFVCIRGEKKPHHKSWYKTINKRLLTHLKQYHDFDLRVEVTKPRVVRDEETGTVSVPKFLVCLQDKDCGAEFECTPEGTYKCIQHLQAEHGIVHIFHKRDTM
jgi:hypothetical protein